jgi:hypothetical protein
VLTPPTSQLSGKDGGSGGAPTDGATKRDLYWTRKRVGDDPLPPPAPDAAATASAAAAAATQDATRTRGRPVEALQAVTAPTLPRRSLSPGEVARLVKDGACPRLALLSGCVGDGVGCWVRVLGFRCVVCGVWCVVCGVWCVVCGVWCVVCGVWCVVFPC